MKTHECNLFGCVGAISYGYSDLHDAVWNPMDSKRHLGFMIQITLLNVAIMEGI